MVGSLNAPCSPGWMGVKDCPLLFLFKGLFHFLKLEGEERGGNKRPLFLSLSVCVPRAFFSHTSLLSVFCLSLSPESTKHCLHSLLSANPSVFLLSFLSCTYISLFSVSYPSYREVTQRSWLTKPIVLFQLWHCKCSPAANYGHLWHFS